MSLYNSKNVNIFFVYLASAFFLSYVSELILLDQGLLVKYYEKFASIDVIDKLLKLRQKWKWVTYILLPFFSLGKFTLISLCIYAGTYLLDYSISISRIFRVVMIAEFIFFIPVLIKLLWFSFIQTEYDLTDLQLFMPLSILQIFNPLNIQNWLIYPLSILNIFELLYWIFLSILLGRELNQRFESMLQLVSSTYGVGLFLWIVMITFISLSLS